MPNGAAPELAKRTYAAFISYSHKDSDICDQLHKRLESYVMPHSLVGRTGPTGKIGRRLGKFFRDRHELGAHPDLGKEIRAALNQSAALIVLCSPNAAASDYVAEEIRLFKAATGSERVFAAIVSGEPHADGKPGWSAADECFPKALIRRLGADGAVTEELEAAEPIAADLREKKDGLENGALKLIAGLLDIGLDDLVQRQKQAEARRRRQAYMISGAMAVLAAGAGAGGVLAYLNGEKLNVANIRLELQSEDLRRTAESLRTQYKEKHTLSERMKAVVEEISEVAEADENVPERLLFLSFAAPLGISARALNIMFDGEIGSMRASEVTNYAGRYCIGVSYCDTSFSVDQMQKDWAEALSPENLALLASVWGGGVKPDDSDREASDPRAAAMARAESEMAGIKVTRRDALRVFGQAQLPAFKEDVSRMWPDADSLPPRSFGALVYVSIYFGPNAIEGLAADMAAGKYPSVPEGIRAMGRERAASAPSARLADMIMARAEEQAKLYQEGLDNAVSGTPDI